MAQAQLPCSLETLTSGTPCLTCLSPIQQQALFIYLLLMVHASLTRGEIASATDLQTATACLQCKSDAELEAFKSQVALNLGINLGAYQAQPTMSEVSQAIHGLANLGAHALHASEVYLLCAILEIVAGQQAT